MPTVNCCWKAASFAKVKLFHSSFLLFYCIKHVLICYLFHLKKTPNNHTHKPHIYSYYLTYLAVFEAVNLSEVNENTGFAHTGDNAVLIWCPFVLSFCLFFGVWFLVWFIFSKRNTNALALSCPVMSIMKSENNDKASSLKMYLTAVRQN